MASNGCGCDVVVVVVGGGAAAEPDVVAAEAVVLVAVGEVDVAEVVAAGIADGMVAVVGDTIGCGLVGEVAATPNVGALGGACEGDTDGGVTELVMMVGGCMLSRL